MSMAVRAVLFDLDDTLFDHRYAARCALQHIQETHASFRQYPLDHLEREDFRLLTEKHALVLAGTLSLEESRIQRIQLLFAGCGETIDIERARQLSAERLEVYRRSRQAVPGAVPLLEELSRQARIAIVTNNFTEEQKGKLDACGMTPLVDFLVTSEETRHVKPSLEIFQIALQQLECNSHNAVMVGDSWDVDILGARNAGIRAVWFNRHGQARPMTNVNEVTELHSFEPVSQAVARILGKTL
jgi:HAD superfamily hydrolase (TIGR01549 family)